MTTSTTTYTDLVGAICRRMEAKPYTDDAVESCDEIERIVGEDIAHVIIRRVDDAERFIRDRDDSDVFHIG